MIDYSDELEFAELLDSQNADETENLGASATRRTD